MGPIDGVGDLKGDSVVSLDISDTVSSSPRVLSLNTSAGNIRHISHHSHTTHNKIDNNVHTYTHTCVGRYTSS